MGRPRSISSSVLDLDFVRVRGTDVSLVAFVVVISILVQIQAEAYMLTLTIWKRHVRYRVFKDFRFGPHTCRYTFLVVWHRLFLR